MEQFYREAKQLYDSDSKFAENARDCVVRLQTGDIGMLAYWRNIVRYSLAEANEIYGRLGVNLSEKDVRGESFYKDMLADVVAKLKKKGLAVESEGAVCVFPEGFKDKEGKPLPVIVQKSDGAYLYATTDLAAIRYRVEKLKADKIIYVTDARQGLHFEMVFAVARMAGWDERQRTEDRGQKTEFVHVTFGSVLGRGWQAVKDAVGRECKTQRTCSMRQSNGRGKSSKRKIPVCHDDER